ncbi:ABC transporter ATP-binding protein [Gordonia sp. PDNC005]|uniref:ABC transporter ATP-binding protein n=1 Tax=unclassified Gordonia (in: high G+C Gram-positive bacteria) TaxID=2657482 RepID=UPI0019644238|nr:ABC transporter ATP-binding protein [Gordonia sp. PDNC005]QRY62633.1 ABC transporter ATP-binding protein [Gordonia sp. PDNC005]
MNDEKPETKVAVRLRQVCKKFGDMTAVDDLDLDIRDGEFFSMLGPSGSGKTTVLRLIGGFELPTSGTIELHGEDVTDKAPFERNVNTVFQDYALFPHMNVLDNVAYGLRVRKVGRAERRERARAALDRVQLGKLADRKPEQLSGGQRQRVAIARALVVEPRVLLLDEPLGALDLKLRREMQVELKELQRSVGITFIFVTHDQEEALTMSDRVGVFNNGALQQVDTPRGLYTRPNSRFVADFVGTSNLFTAQAATRRYGRDTEFTLRPEQIAFGELPGADRSSGSGEVTSVAYLGATTHVTVRLDDGTEIVALHPGGGDGIEPGQAVTVSWSDADVVWLPQTAA